MYKSEYLGNHLNLKKGEHGTSGKMSWMLRNMFGHVLCCEGSLLRL